MNRRNFIKTGAGAFASSIVMPSVLSAACCNQCKSIGIGLQVYSVRNPLKKDFEGSLEKIAKIGYQNIEAYGLGEDSTFLGKHEAAYYKKRCEDLGLKLVATHSSYFTKENAQGFIDGALGAGLEHLIIPYIPEELRKSADDYKKIAENLNEVGELCKKAGLNFGYHNHAFEFEKVDGLTPMEILIEETASENVSFELDLYWVTKGRLDANAFVEKHLGRFSCFHIKDADKDLNGATVGQGIIDFKKIFETNKKFLKYYFVEDERTDTPFKNIKSAFDYLSTSEFAI